MLPRQSLQPGQQGKTAVAVTPAGLDETTAGIIQQKGYGLPEKIGRGHEIRVEDRHEFTPGRQKAVGKGARLVPPAVGAMQMMDVVQAPGYGRKIPMRAQAVLIAGPEDRRKVRNGWAIIW